MEPKYWNEEGKFQKEYDYLFDKLVPTMGNAETKLGEVLRIVSKFYYEIWNNGNINARDEVEVYYDEYDVDDTDTCTKVSDYYQEMLNYLHEVYPQFEETYNQIEYIILNYLDDTEKAVEIYDKFVDDIMEEVIKEYIETIAIDDAKEFIKSPILNIMNNISLSGINCEKLNEFINVSEAQDNKKAKYIKIYDDCIALNIPQNVKSEMIDYIQDNLNEIKINSMLYQSEKEIYLAKYPFLK